MTESTDGSDRSTSEDADADRVVTAFLRNRGEVLLLRRDGVGTYAGQWGGVSGFAEGAPDEQVRVEIAEETDLDDSVSLVRSGRPVEFADPDLDREWAVHPYLFECDSRNVTLSEEHDAFAWVPPTAILDPDRGTVPKLWTAYERVAPTVRSIAADDDHGAASLSIRALEVLRDRAGLLVSERKDDATDDVGGDGDVEGVEDATAVDAGDDRTATEWDELAELARRLLEARPAMAVLRNRVNRAMADATDRERSAAGVLEAAIDGVERAIAADEDAAAEASEVVDGRVLTLSRSGTVLDAIRQGAPTRVFVAESRPAREGVAVAEALAEEVPVTLHTDAAAAHLLAREAIDAVVVGADTVLPDGRLVNKTGTRAAAIAARREGIPVYAVAASDKVSTRETVNLESGDRSAVYDGDAPIDVANPTFDVTPADCLTAVVTEEGELRGEAIGDVAAKLREREAWEDR